jgi:membrane protein
MAQLERHGHTPETSTMATVKRVVREFKEDNTTDWAAALTYYGLLSLFPALIAMVSIVGLVGDPQKTTDTLLDIVAQLGPETGVQTFREPIEAVTSNRSGAGIGLVVGILLALNAASNYVGAFMRASNQQYEVDEGRPFWKLRPLQIGVTLVCLILVAITATAIVATGPVAEAVGNAIGLGSTAIDIWQIAKWPFLIAIVALIISILYYAAPNAKIDGFKFVTVGSAVAIVFWLVASVLFALYVANFGSYNKTYGTLGGVVGFLVWVWITNIAILLGNKVNAERERTKQLAAGDMRAEEEIQLPERDAPKLEKRPKTA